MLRACNCSIPQTIQNKKLLECLMRIQGNNVGVSLNQYENNIKYIWYFSDTRELKIIPQTFAHWIRLSNLDPKLIQKLAFKFLLLLIKIMTTDALLGPEQGFITSKTLPAISSLSPEKILLFWSIYSNCRFSIQFYSKRFYSYSLYFLDTLSINIWFIGTILNQVNLTRTKNIKFHTLLLVPKVWCLACRVQILPIWSTTNVHK